VRVLMIMVLLCTALSAQEKKTEGCRLPKPSPTFFAVSVADVEKSAQWYKDALGFTLTDQQDAEDGAFRVRILQCGGVILELMQLKDASAAPKATPVHGISKVGIMISSVDALVADLKSRKIDIFMGPFPAKPRQLRNFLLKDGDGVLLQFFEREAAQ
jgi:catechol 2,3-dioxygenase-like lactoylglutathione lyase family enzyme